MSENENIPGAPDRKSNDLVIPSRLQGKLESFQERLWSVKIAEGALAGVVGLTLSFLFVFILDRFIDTPAWLRTILFVAGFCVPALGLPLRWRRWVWQQRSLEQVSRLLRKTYPKLGDELLGIVELAKSDEHGNSDVLVKAAMQQVDERVAEKSFDNAVPANRYRSWVSGTIAAIALLAAMFVLINDASRNALQRWVSPWKDVDRYTFAQIDELPEKVVVPLAESFPINPNLAETTEWEPGEATVKLPGKTKLRSQRENGEYPFEIPPQKADGELALRVGDVIHKVEVTPLPRPELTELEAVLRLPDYLRYEGNTTIPVRGNTVSILTGSTASIRGTTSRDLAVAEGSDGPVRVNGASFSSAPAPVTEAVRKSFSWKDVHGLEAKSPLEITLQPVEDEAPDVFARQTSAERVVLHDEVVTFDVSASDDFGLRGVGLEWRNAVAPAEGEDGVYGEKPIVAGAPDKKQISSTGTFSAARENIEPQTLHLRAFAEDYLPSRERAYSATFILHVLNNEDHAQWLTEEFGKWFRNAREVYEREQQLYESNRELRKLDSTELDRPDNRRKLSEQASAESANARRLDALTRSGRDLVGEATKNKEFDAERLESWATMMRSLDDIAKNRMPSVSDLLKKASASPGGGSPKTGSQPGEEEKKQPEGQQNQSAGAPSVDNGLDEENANNASGEPGEEKSSASPVPTITDKESSMAKQEDKSNGEEEKPPAKAGKGALGLPQTTLGPAPQDKATPPAESPAQEKLDEALAEQKDLIEEFAKVTEQLQEILSSLEASTFVKRLKAASREQTKLATTLGQTIKGGFGLPKQKIEQQLREVGEVVSKEQEVQSKFVYHIQNDLAAYFQRKQDPIFNNVLEQMKDYSVVSRLKVIGDESRVNLNGRSIAASQYWADTLDRWAEELVAASNCKPCNGNGSKESLPPEIVLKIMQALQDEMALREETREMEATKTAFAPDEYAARVAPLEQKQEDIRAHLDTALADIFVLDDAEKHFGKEIQLLRVVSDIMRESRSILARPETGYEVIATQTEAIELLLQAKRQKPGGGGGGGGSNPGGGGSASGGQGGASLTDIGPGGSIEGGSNPVAREVDQSTGKAGRELPEEFRFGLDTYFNELQSN